MTQSFMSRSKLKRKKSNIGNMSGYVAPDKAIKKQEESKAIEKVEKKN